MKLKQILEIINQATEKKIPYDANKLTNFYKGNKKIDMTNWEIRTSVLNSGQSWNLCTNNPSSDPKIKISYKPVEAKTFRDIELNLSVLRKEIYSAQEGFKNELSSDYLNDLTKINDRIRNHESEILKKGLSSFSSIYNFYFLEIAENKKALTKEKLDFFIKKVNKEIERVTDIIKKQLETNKFIYPEEMNLSEKDSKIYEYIHGRIYKIIRSYVSKHSSVLNNSKKEGMKKFLENKDLKESTVLIKKLICFL